MNQPVYSLFLILIYFIHEALEYKEFISSFILYILINIKNEHKSEKDSCTTKKVPDIMVVIEIEKFAHFGIFSNHIMGKQVEF